MIRPQNLVAKLWAGIALLLSFTVGAQALANYFAQPIQEIDSANSATVAGLPAWQARLPELWREAAEML
jgi:hypothetical protein